MPELDLVDLVANRTMSPEVAATLATAAEQRRSFMVVAVPRLAGKSTVMEATLAHRPRGTPLHRLIEHPRDVDALPSLPDGGYLVVPEVSQGPMPGYIWGEPVRRVFSLLEGGYSLATSLHAPGIEDAFEQLTVANGVPDEQAAGVQLAVYLRTLGADWRNPTRRVVAEVHEVAGVSGGRPRATLLHHWDERADHFEQHALPSWLDGAANALDRRARALQRAAEGRRGVPRARGES